MGMEERSCEAVGEAATPRGGRQRDRGPGRWVTLYVVIAHQQDIDTRHIPAPTNSRDSTRSRWRGILLATPRYKRSHDHTWTVERHITQEGARCRCANYSAVRPPVALGNGGCTRKHGRGRGRLNKAGNMGTSPCLVTLRTRRDDGGQDELKAQPVNRGSGKGKCM